jgi:hypothetical protein
MTRTIIAATVSLVLLVVAGCDSDSPDNKATQKRPIDPLGKISPEVYMMKVMNAVARESDCFAAESSSLKVDPNSALSKDFMGPIIEGYKKGCAFWKKLEPITAPIYQRIIQEGSVPPSMYFFDKFEIDLNGGYETEQVGLFDNFETCQKFETEYQSFGDGTGRCKEWKDLLKIIQPQKPPIAN